MYYRPDFLSQVWQDFGVENSDLDPDAFLRFGYGQLLQARQPRYAAMAKWGVTVTAEEIAKVQDAAGFTDLIAKALERA